MSGSEEAPLAPDRFLLINDPDTGQRDATLELWDLGEHNQAVMEAVRKFAALNGGELGRVPQRDERGLSLQVLAAAFELKTSLPKAPKEAHFVVVGEEHSCAIRVSYRGPRETLPSSHPGIHAAIGDLVGARYITIKQWVFKGRPQT